MTRRALLGERASLHVPPLPWKAGLEIDVVSGSNAGEGDLRRPGPSPQLAGRITALQPLAAALVLLLLGHLLTWVNLVQLHGMKHSLPFVAQSIPLQGNSHRCNGFMRGLEVLCRGIDCVIPLYCLLYKKLLGMDKCHQEPRDSPRSVPATCLYIFVLLLEEI